ncbi:MAG: hypothetical protein ACOY3Z_03705 [Thermodesulfobacteriota bacterium]
MTVIRFAILDEVVRFGGRERQMLTANGCNEPYKNRYWCPKRKWFNSEPCPFSCQQECDNYQAMCGAL